MRYRTESSLLSIGKMAAMNHTTIPTLRLYDKLGLLKPSHVDIKTGYRYYDIQQNARFDLIEYMKELGMSLKEIASVLDCHDSALVETILAQKNEQIHRQIRGLKLRHDAIERAISSLERYRKSPATGTISLVMTAAMVLASELHIVIVLANIDARTSPIIPVGRNLFVSDA